MYFAFSEEQELLRAAARDYLGDRYPTDRVVELVESDAGWDPQSWTELTEMGWLDDELGVLEHAVLAEETGRALFPGPLFSTLALARPAGYDGAQPGTLAHFPDPTVTAKGDTLSGSKSFVPDLAASAS